MSAIYLFLSVESANSAEFFIVYTLIDVGNTCENISVEQTYSKHLPPDIRGSLNSVQFLMQSIGLMILAKITGVLYDTVGYKMPFFIIGGCDLFFACFVMVMGLLGKLRETNSENENEY